MCPALQLSGWKVGLVEDGVHISVEESQEHGRIGTSEDPCPKYMLRVDWVDFSLRV
jgi:hypothetical protein